MAGNGSHKVRYQATRNFNKTDKFSRITFYYAHAPSGAYVEYSLDGQPDMVAELKPGESIQSLVLNETTPVKTIDIKFVNCQSAYIYGVNFDDRTGVYVDNYSMRGYSGMFFYKIPLDIMEDFQQYLNYDLIILQYGANVSNPNCRNYDFYKRGMVNSINHIKKIFPNTPILVVSTADKGARINGRYQTSPDIPALVKTQYEIARETNSGFWNLYEAMGGYNSIVNFVNAKPPMANHDYTHFTYHGTNKVADLLTQTIMGEYDKYRSNRNSGRLSDVRY